MKKILISAAVATLVAAQAFATYVVVLKDGTQYKAKSRWTVVNGKALVSLENGQLLQLDPALIDLARTERTNKLGITTGGSLIDLTPDVPRQEAPKQQPSLGTRVKLKQLPPEKRPTPAPETPLPGTADPSIAPAASGGSVNQDVLDKFDRAYENVGIFEKTISASGSRAVRAELTTDSEEKIFNAISATSFLLVRNAGVTGAQIDTVELFMKTTNGGAAGRFQMTRADAEALDKKKMSQQDYFVRRVIY